MDDYYVNRLEELRRKAKEDPRWMFRERETSHLAQAYHHLIIAHAELLKGWSVPETDEEHARWDAQEEKIFAVEESIQQLEKLNLFPREYYARKTFPTEELLPV